MKLKNTLRKAVFLFIFSLFSHQNSFSQCFQIESILVDACDGNTNSEGLNEMVRFKVGNTAINTSNLSVDWPNNTWGGLIKNSLTASKVANLNADILDAGGCGQLIEPTGGVLPANATVILVTSYNFDITSNSFGALTENIYILFQNSNTTSGHFANYGSGIRTLSISFGSCSDTVSYDRSFLINQAGNNAAGDGATVIYTPSGTPTYINNGCIAPVPPFTVDGGPTTLSVCTGNSISLTGIAQGHQTVLWSAPSGTFFAPNNLATIYTPSSSSAGSVVILTLTATNSCGVQITDTINLTVTNGVIPSFNITPLTICRASSVPVLSTISPNGITGTWSPATISNTISGNYVFTPNTGQCATTVTLPVTITNSITPNFNVAPITICRASTPPVLSTISPNGITGIWNPATISNTISGNYVFTPNSGQCATTVTLPVTITNSIIPSFNVAPITICTGSTPPVLSTISPNGISGIWTPATISNTISGNYVFTPNSGQCATTVTLPVTITNSITPNFNVAPITICTGSTPPVLSTISPNGITGTWNPATISNSISGNYVFTPNTGQCATTVTLPVTITNSITPSFNVAPITICTASTPPVLSNTSPNGISGTWNPATISNAISGNYIFTPNAGQCATTVIFPVTVTTANIVPNFDITPITLCSGSIAPILNMTSPNGISGTWNPTIISNTISGSYTFTPNSGQCATSVILNVTITSGIIPDFATTLTLCNGSTAPTLTTTSPNGITGTWNPSTINNISSGSYIFTPNTGQCATSVALNVTIENLKVEITDNCVEGNLVLKASPVSNSYNPNDADYTWKNASGTTVGTNNEIFNVSDYLSSFSNPTYPIKFSVTVKNNGCETTESFTVYSVACNIPKGVSPNGDGDNDEFDLTGFNVRKLEIFNRYGTKVNSFTNYTKEWHGQSDSGNDLPDGTYYYVIERDGIKTATGWVQINRQRN